MSPTETITTETKPSSPSNLTDTTTIPESPTATEGLLFQAVGIIRGEVNFSDDAPATVTLKQKQYRLDYVRNPLALSGLKQEIEKTGQHTQRLIVYPKVIHFPKRDQPHQISFQLVGFDLGREPNGISSELEDNQFKLSGLWQFIPVCRPTCISVFRNFDPKLLKYIHQLDNPAKKVRVLKARHLPLLWKDAPVRPFRFNPKGRKDQGLPPFVSIKAVFIPHRDAFGFVELLSEPQEQAPKFLKARKEDKAQVQKSAREQAPSGNKSQVNSPKSRKSKVLPSPKRLFRHKLDGHQQFLTRFVVGVTWN